MVPNATVTKALGSFLREKRNRAGFSLRYVARIIGLDHARLARIERGQAVPTLPSLIRIARAYGIKASAAMRHVGE